MMMQWFINEMREFKASISERVEGWAREQISASERIYKLEGELKALKARMGKNKQE